MWQALFRVSDTGMNILLLFLAKFLSLVGAVTKLNINGFIDQLPQTITTARKLIGNVVDNFSRYASCPKCHSIYPLHTCSITSSDRTKRSRHCSHVEYPDHPHATRRRPCNTPLMKVVRTSAGTTTLQARQLYCYRSLIESLRNFMKRPNFVTKCEAWRKRVIVNETLNDVYDGRVWNDFMNPNGIAFLSLPYNLALSMNIDWFQPFKHSTYSMGAIYIAVQNLPREERYNSENIILTGVIPGPREPKKTMNSYLRPLVDELKILWDGVVMNCASGTPLIVRAALLCTSCDIPAARKVSGFVGHSAYRACSRCLKPFPTAAFGEKPDYSGFCRGMWSPRTTESHVVHATRYKCAKTHKERKAIEREYGCRYSVLLELPYYDIVRFCVIDPMHNLLLGTAKHMLTLWKSCDIINDSQFQNIQDKVDAFVTPSDVGRIPGKIASGFSSFTAEQWRNWTLIYSLASLKDILPHRHYDCWLLFVKSTSLLCRRSITLQELDKADMLLMEFCEMFEQLYGKEKCTINMHLHGHLKECMLDFGPVYSFWLFSFERMNGILGAYHTNSRDIPLQVMRRFLASDYYNIHNWPTQFKDELSPLLVKHRYEKGSLLSTSLKQCLADSKLVKPLPPIHEVAWETHQKRSISADLTPFIEHEDYTLLTLYQKSSALSVGGFILGSSSSRFVTTACVMATHPNHPDQLNFARIECFAKLDIKDNRNTSTISVWTACVRFYEEHPCKLWYGGPTQIWTRTTSLDVFYIPLHFIKNRVAYSETSVNFGRIIGTETVYIVSLLSN